MTVKLRDYQDRVIKKALGYFDEGNPSVLIESPTGSGKSIMGLALAKFFEDKYGWSTNWVAMRRNLLHQIKEMNSQFFDLKNLNTVSMFDKNPPEADFIVIDEAQHDAAASATHIHIKTKPKKILGLSATPYRTDKLKLSFSRVIKDAGIHRLIQEGFLSKFQHWVIDSFTPVSVAETFLAEPEKWGKSIVYFHSLTQCYNFKRIMMENRIGCEVISSQDSFPHRESILDRFDEGGFQVLVNVAILTEGFDCPTLKSVFVRDSSKLPTIQMSGRGLRIDPSKNHCNIVQSKKSPWPFTRTASPSSSFVFEKGDWMSLSGANEIVDSAVKNSFNLLFEAEVVIPPFILKNKKIRMRRRMLH